MRLLWFTLPPLLFCKRGLESCREWKRWEKRGSFSKFTLNIIIINICIIITPIWWLRVKSLQRLFPSLNWLILQVQRQIHLKFLSHFGQYHRRSNSTATQEATIHSLFSHLHGRMFLIVILTLILVLIHPFICKKRKTKLFIWLLFFFTLVSKCISLSIIFFQSFLSFSCNFNR